MFAIEQSEVLSVTGLANVWFAEIVSGFSGYGTSNVPSSAVVDTIAGRRKKAPLA